MQTKQLQKLVIKILEDHKAHQILAFDVRKMTTITDIVIVCSGTSNRHVKSLADAINKTVKEKGIMPFGMEGHQEGEWVLVDLLDVVVHIMLPKARDFYRLEELWENEEVESVKKPRTRKKADETADTAKKPRTRKKANETADAAKKPRTHKRVKAPRKSPARKKK